LQNFDAAVRLFLQWAQDACLRFPHNKVKISLGQVSEIEKTNAMLETSAQLSLWAEFTHILHIIFMKIPFHSNCQMPQTMYVLRTI